jgi:GNAT superfamily N-acetyltransferase
MMGTIPTYQRRGAGSLHLSWGVRIADREGLICWTEASPVSVPLYEKFGFKVVETVEMELHESCGGGKYTYTCMLREPRSEE